MSETQKSTRLFWIIFLVSLIACVGFLVLAPEWFWVTLPSLLTSLVMALDKM